MPRSCRLARTRGWPPATAGPGATHDRTARSSPTPGSATGFRPWTLKGDRSVGDAPPAALWASDERGFGEVGCVYTAQGSEYEWNGVLLGPDLVWRTDRWVAVRSANRDPDFRSTKRVSDADFDLLVRNVYKVLLTRGLRGVYLHSTDPETQRFLEILVG